MRSLPAVVFATVIGGIAAQTDAAADAAAAAKAKGMVEVGGVWVDKAQVADAKRGVFHFGDDLVTKDEYRELSAGKVRHPVTGRIIPADDLERARGRSFPIGTEDRWVDEHEADRYHAEASRPWQVFTRYYVLVSTLPIAKIETIREYADHAVERLRPILGFAEPMPIDRPTIVAAATQDQFIALGNQLGDESSAFGAFLARDGSMIRVPLQGEVRPAICHWDDGWGPYNLPHAFGLAYVNGLCAASGTEVDAWFLHAIAAYGSRFVKPETGAWFAQGLARAGGIKDLGSWFDKFKIDGSMATEDIGANMTQAGLLIDFCVAGGDKEATAALQRVTEAFPKGKASGIAKAVDGLHKVLAQKHRQIGEYLQKLAQ
jgi:hypothetical protein